MLISNDTVYCIFLFEMLFVVCNISLCLKSRIFLLYWIDITFHNFQLFRTIDEIDYQCRVDIVTDESKGVYLLLVIKYPNPLGVSCEVNPNAFAIFKKEHCIRVCDQVEYKKYPSKLLKLYMTGRVRLRFVSNSSVNADINVSSQYQFY